MEVQCYDFKTPFTPKSIKFPEFNKFERRYDKHTRRDNLRFLKLLRKYGITPYRLQGWKKSNYDVSRTFCNKMNNVFFEAFYSPYRAAMRIPYLTNLREYNYKKAIESAIDKRISWWQINVTTKTVDLKEQGTISLIFHNETIISEYTFTDMEEFGLHTLLLTGILSLLESWSVKYRQGDTSFGELMKKMLTVIDRMDKDLTTKGMCAYKDKRMWRKYINCLSGRKYHMKVLRDIWHKLF